MFEFLNKTFGNTQEPKWGAVLGTLVTALVGGAVAMFSGGGVGMILAGLALGIGGGTLLSGMFQNMLPGGDKDDLPRHTAEAGPHKGLMQEVGLKIDVPGQAEPVSVALQMPDVDIVKDSAKRLASTAQMETARESVLSATKEELEKAKDNYRGLQRNNSAFGADVLEKWDPYTKDFNENKVGVLRDSIRELRRNLGLAAYSEDQLKELVPVAKPMDLTLKDLTARHLEYADRTYKGEFGKDENTNTPLKRVTQLNNQLIDTIKKNKPDWENDAWLKEYSGSNPHFLGLGKNELKSQVREIKHALEFKHYDRAMELADEGLKKLREDKDPDFVAQQAHVEKYFEQFRSYANAEKLLPEIAILDRHNTDQIYTNQNTFITNLSEHKQAMTKVQEEINHLNGLQRQRQVEQKAATPDPQKKQTTALSDDVMRKVAAEVRGNGALQFEQAEEGTLLSAASTPAKIKAEQQKKHPAQKLGSGPEALA